MRIVRIVLISLVVLLVGVSAFFLYATYSEGSRAGTVAKFSRKGVLVKTHEGQLNVGAFTQSEGSFAPEIWDFSVRRSEEQVIADLEQALLEGYRVKLYYKEKYAQLFWRGDTQYFVYRVETLGGRPAR